MSDTLLMSEEMEKEECDPSVHWEIVSWIVMIRADSDSAITEHQEKDTKCNNKVQNSKHLD